jgi:hypothetical protein
MPDLIQMRDRAAPGRKGTFGDLADHRAQFLCLSGLGRVEYFLGLNLDQHLAHFSDTRADLGCPLSRRAHQLI